MPFESTFAEGRAYLQAVETPGKFIVVAGIWIIFGPMLVLGVGLLVILDWRALGKLENALSLAGGLALSVIALIVMGRTTLAYWRGRR